MKTWAQIEGDPEYTSAPLPVKREVKAAHLKALSQAPEFLALSPEEQKQVAAHVQGGYPTAVQAAAHLVAASLSGEVERALLEKDKAGMVQDLLDAATAAEKHLDVPLKDRQREKFPELAHFHVDKQLRALLCFIEEGLPEYRAYRKWQVRAALPLAQQILEAQQAGHEPGADLGPVGHAPLTILPPRATIRTPEDLDVALARILPAVAPEARARLAAGGIPGPAAALAHEKLLRENPEAALKAYSPRGQWAALDQRVLQAVGRGLVGAGDRFGAEATPLAVRAAVAAATARAYEALARAAFPAPPAPVAGPPRPFPWRPDAVAEYVLGALAASDGHAFLAHQFPGVYVALMGMADVPAAARPAYEAAVAKVARGARLPQLDASSLVAAVARGRASLVLLGKADEKLFAAAAEAAGVPPSMRAHLAADLQTAQAQPAATAILGCAAAQANVAFQTARKSAMAEVAREAHRAMAPAAPGPAPEESTPASQPPKQPLRAALRASPVSAASLKAMGLWADFAPYGVAAPEGRPLPEVMKGLSAMGLLPPDASPPDLLDALDRERVPQGAPA